jgi:energy-coupling factor transport system ATP-binding protein
MKETIKQNNLIIKDYSKKIRDSLKIVGLDETYLERTLVTLSSSEKKILQYALSLISNPELIIINEPFKFLDNKNEKKIFMLLQRLKEQFNINIILLSNDSNILHKYTDNILFIKNNEVILEGKTTEVYQRVDYLKKNKFSIPEIIEFTYLAKKKKSVKIDYHRDIRDIIKDIYKHV